MSDTDWDYSNIELENGLKYNVHTLFQDMSNEKVIKYSKKFSIPLAILLINLDGNMNIGMSIRSASILGCSDVYIIGKKKYDARSAVGAKNYINIHKIPEIDPETFFKENNLFPILVEQGGEALETFNFKTIIRQSEKDGLKPIILLGSESKGIPKEWMKVGPCVSISQLGIVRSMNVSIAASIVLYEFTKQWRELQVL